MGVQTFTRGVVDLLTHPHGPDRYLELLAPHLSRRQVRARVESVRHPAPGAVTLVLRPNRTWQGFRAGQHVQLAVDVDGVLQRRCYSMVGSEHDRSGRLELTVHTVAGGLVSPRVAASVRPSAVVLLSQAQGPFVLPDERPERLLLISGGSGITPVLSMLRTLCDERRAATVTFLHYARTPGDVAHRAELDALAAAHPGLRVLRSYTRSGTGELAGRFGPGHLARALAGADVPGWACGPAGLVESVREHWTGSSPLQLEHFTPPTPVAVPPGADAPAGTVEFTASGVTARGDGRPLLEQAEAAGLTPPSGCRMGICWTCTSRRTSGTTRHLRTGAVSTDPDCDIQLCVTVPVGDVRIDL